MKREKEEEHKFVKWCREKNFTCHKMKIIGRKYFPDRTVHLGGGVTAYFEFKRTAKSYISVGQVREIEQLRNLGYLATIVCTADEAKTLTRALSFGHVDWGRGWLAPSSSSNYYLYHKYMPVSLTALSRYPNTQGFFGGLKCTCTHYCPFACTGSCGCHACSSRAGKTVS